MYVERNTEARSRNIVAVEGQYLLLFDLCVRARVHVGTRACGHVHFALLIQHATRMRHIVNVICGPSVSTTFFGIIS